MYATRGTGRARRGFDWPQPQSNRKAGGDAEPIRARDVSHIPVGRNADKILLPRVMFSTGKKQYFAGARNLFIIIHK